MLDSKKIHRVYVVDDDGNLEGVITLRDIISRLVHEPRGYFGDFFDGVLPLPQNSRVWKRNTCQEQQQVLILVSNYLGLTFWVS